jgi:hypothetical protein
MLLRSQAYLRAEVDDINLGLEHFYGRFNVVHTRIISSGVMYKHLHGDRYIAHLSSDKRLPSPGGTYCPFSETWRSHRLRGTRLHSSRREQKSHHARPYYPRWSVVPALDDASKASSSSARRRRQRCESTTSLGHQSWRLRGHRLPTILAPYLSVAEGRRPTDSLVEGCRRSDARGHLCSSSAMIGILIRMLIRLF